MTTGELSEIDKNITPFYMNLKKVVDPPSKENDIEGEERWTNSKLI